MLSFTERNELERVLSGSLSNSLLSVPGTLKFCVRTTALILPLIKLLLSVCNIIKQPKRGNIKYAKQN